MKTVFTFLFIFFSLNVFSQLNIKEIELNKKLSETSGLELINDTLITINDSGNSNKIFLLNKKGEILKSKKINGIKNTDWEDLTKDQKYIYIHDFGNNKSVRDTFYIHKIDINNYKLKQTLTIIPKTNDTNFDSEALVNLNETELLFFTKNKKSTRVYIVNKTLVYQNISHINEYDFISSITGADYSQKMKKIVLTSLDKKNNYLIVIDDYDPFLNSFVYKKLTLPIQKAQIESVKIIDENNYILTSESSKKFKARLIYLKLSK